MKRPAVAVVGGGISGLAAAHRLIAEDSDAQVVLLEASPRLGGCLRGAQLGGVQIDVGPESLLARVPWGVELLEQLGLKDRLISPAPIGAHLWLRGALRPLPPGLMTGQASARAIRRAGLLTTAGQLRAGLDFVMPGRPQLDDESVAEAIGSRLGPEAVTAIADTLLGGVYAGSADRLSTQAAMPFLATARRQGGSLLRALKNRPAGPDGPVFVSIPGGLSQLPGIIGDKLAESGADVRLKTEVETIRPVPDGVEIAIGDGTTLVTDSVVLALPAVRAAKLVAPHAPLAAAQLVQIAHADVAIVSFAFPADTELPVSSGFLAGRAEGLTISACTLTSRKWPDLAPDGPVLLRCSIGRVGSPPAGHDDELLRAARADLKTTLAIDAAPIDARVERFADALPQHDVGHLERLRIIEEDVARALPQVSLAGAWTRGIGIAACIRDGRNAAEAAIMAAPSAPDLGA